MVRSAAKKSSAVAECQAQGMTQRQTSEKLGMSLSFVQTHWARTGVPGRPSNKNAIAPLIAEGKTDKQISIELNISVSTVNRQRHAIDMKKNSKMGTRKPRIVPS